MDEIDPKAAAIRIKMGRDAHHRKLLEIEALISQLPEAERIKLEKEREIKVILKILKDRRASLKKAQ